MNLTSTVDVRSSSLHPTTTTSPSPPHLVPTTDLKPIRCPSPLLRDVGPSPSCLMGEYEYAQGGREEPGDPRSGRRGTRGASRKRARRKSQLVFVLSSLLPPLTIPKPNADVANRATPPRPSISATMTRESHISSHTDVSNDTNADGTPRRSVE